MTTIVKVTYIEPAHAEWYPTVVLKEQIYSSNCKSPRSRLPLFYLKSDAVGYVESCSTPEQSSVIKGLSALHRAQMQLYQNLNFTGSQYIVRCFVYA